MNGSSKYRVLVVSGSPDDLNTNSVLLNYVAEGIVGAFARAKVVCCSSSEGALTIRRFQPDLLVVFGSVVFDQSDFADLHWEAKRLKATLVFWLHDDPYEFDMNSRIFRFADLVCTNDKASLDHFPPEVRVMHLPLAASSTAHVRPIRRKEKPDLFFCGHGFQNRRRFFTSLHETTRSQRRDVLVCGSHWNQADAPFFCNVRIANGDLPDFYSSAKAVANIGRDLNLSNHKYQIRPSTPGPRTFEAAMAGAAQIFLTEGLEILEYFDAGEEILIANNVEEFADTWSRLLAHPVESVRIGIQAQARALAEHSYERRANRLLTVVLGVDSL